MPETNDVDITRRVVISEETDAPTRWLLWGVFAALLMLGALIAYAWMSGLADSYFRVERPANCRGASVGGLGGGDPEESHFRRCIRGQSRDSVPARQEGRGLPGSRPGRGP